MLSLFCAFLSIGGIIGMWKSRDYDDQAANAIAAMVFSVAGLMAVMVGA